jgi:hypothetical protein
MRELRTQERRPVRSGVCWAGWRPYTGYHPPPATLFQSKNERRPQQEGRRSAWHHLRSVEDEVTR